MFDLDGVLVRGSRGREPTRDHARGGFYAVTNLPLVDIVRYAYGIPEAQIVGGPGWMRTTRFDIAAKASGDVPAEQVPLMVQSLLLEERFRLRARRERREMPILAY